jgi:CheY-like chemotaxis protein
VVDDNVDTAEGLSRILKRDGHRVTLAHDGYAALQMAEAGCPEVVLLDIGLPGIDGYEVARRLRQDIHCKAALVIALSGYGQEEDRRRSRTAGFGLVAATPALPIALSAFHLLISFGRLPQNAVSPCATPELA